MIKAINILWDYEEEDEIKQGDLPDVVIIPHTVCSDDDDSISDYITQKVGFCHRGFEIKECDTEEIVSYVAELHSNPLDFVYTLMSLVLMDKETLFSYLSEIFSYKYSNEELQGVVDTYYKNK